MSNKACERCGSTKKCCSIFMAYRMGLVRLCNECHEAYHDMIIKAEENFLAGKDIIRVEVTEIHTFATPEDTSGLKFGD